MCERTSQQSTRTTDFREANSKIEQLHLVDQAVVVTIQSYSSPQTADTCKRTLAWHHSITISLTDIRHSHIRLTQERTTSLVTTTAQAILDLNSSKVAQISSQKSMYSVKG
jgi:hypothetical protein